MVLYIPIVTTLLSLFFAWNIFNRYRKRGGGIHLLWWSGGVLVYGLGTFAESWITILGWNPVIFKFWYIVGALMGGAPLATGTVWFLLKPRSARIWTTLLILVVLISSIFVILSPIKWDIVNSHLPSGRVFGWQWVRVFSPFINTYAVVFLVGGALISAWRFRKFRSEKGKGALIARDRFIGNVCIAVGALLPGIGGVSSRIGHTEVLYIMEVVGLILIWIGYWFNVRKRPVQNVKVASGYR